MSEQFELPSGFFERISAVLTDDTDEFMHSLMGERTYALRLNPGKVTDENVTSALDDLGVKSPDPVPWCREGYYYNSDSCPGRSPYHEAGVCYIQEPSAMLVGELLDPRPGERICDLCAAPGGKTTHIAGRMCGEGVLISNEIVPDRARILARNVERMGITNCIVTSESPAKLAQVLPGFFHRVCVDAPCSGEGMFRKDEIARNEWSVENVDRCVERQREILDAASMLVMSGGVLVYSTCTFERSENEDMIADFLADHPDFSLAKADESVIRTGITLSEINNPKQGAMYRVWPHRVRGEGHFAAVLRKDGELTPVSKSRSEDFRKKNVYDPEKFIRFLHTEASFLEGSDLINTIKRSRIKETNGYINLIPDNIEDVILNKLRVIKTGVCIASYDGKRFKPEHALAMASKHSDLRNMIELNYKETCAFIRGETIDVSSKELDIPSGQWAIACIDGYPVGWGKLVGNILKNHYPKGLRRNIEILNTEEYYIRN